MIALDPVRDTADRTSWGWIAVLYGVCEGSWVRGGPASTLVGVTTGTLIRWAEAGVITQIRPRPKEHRTYLRAELEIVMCIIRSSDSAPLDAIREHINRAVGGET